MKVNMFKIQTKDGTDLYGQVCCELKNQDIWTDILEYFLKYLNFKHGMGKKSRNVKFTMGVLVISKGQLKTH